MPNIENIKLAITVMERVKKNEEELGRQQLDMGLFPANIYHSYAPTLETAEEAVNSCGTICCLAGWLAVSPEFRKQGYSLNKYGTPILSGKNIDESIAFLLGIDEKTAFGLIHNSKDDGFYYEKYTDEVTVDDVIRKLKALIGEE